MLSDNNSRIGSSAEHISDDAHSESACPMKDNHGTYFIKEKTGETKMAVYNVLLILIKQHCDRLLKQGL